MLWRPETEEIAVTDRTEAAGLQVATRLYRFIEDEALPAAEAPFQPNGTGTRRRPGYRLLIAEYSPRMANRSTLVL